jgi:phospholipid/cholesterol/gamma-HCH transport system substrate-binding protein
VTSVRPSPAAPPSVTAKRLLSLEGIQESRPARALFGLLLSALVIGIIYAIVLSFTGHFTNVVPINAQLPEGSNAVTVGAPVEYRNVTVGKVATETEGPNGSISVRFEMYPARMAHVPNGVEAEVAPLSIFGNQYVELVPPAQIGSAHLAAGDFVRAYAAAPSTSLQGTVTQLYDLLHAVHPADLDTALTALATALQGEGTNLGQALSDASQYFGAIQPHLSTVQSDLKLLDPVSAHLQAAAPDLLGLLSNSSVTAQTITNQQAQLHTVLTTGQSATKRFADILQQSQGALISLMNQSGPLLSDVTANPNELSLTLQGLGQWAAAWAAAESNGPYMSVTANLPIADISSGVNAALGYDNPASISAALGSAFNPATYSAANCPQYPGEANPYCGTGGSPAATPPGGSSVSAAAYRQPAAQPTAPQANQQQAYAGPSTPYLDELRAIDAIAMALNGGTAPPSPALASMVLFPLLSSMSGAQ